MKKTIISAGPAGTGKLLAVAVALTMLFEKKKRELFCLVQQLKLEKD